MFLPPPKSLRMSLSLQARDEKTVHGVEKHWLTGKENVHVKKVMLAVFWDMKGPIA